MKYQKELLEIVELRNQITQLHNEIVHYETLKIARQNSLKAFHELVKPENPYIKFYPHAGIAFDNLHMITENYLNDLVTECLSRIESSKVRLQRVQKQISLVRSKLSRISGASFSEVKELEKQILQAVK